MRFPSALGLLFLGYLLIGLPWLAFRSAARFHGRQPGQPTPTRRQVWASTITLMAALLALSWLTGREFDYTFFAWPGWSVPGLLSGCASLAVLFLLRHLVRRSRTDAERRQLAVYSFAPRTAAEWRMVVVMIAVASVTEEIAYRGVAHSLLWWMLGNGWIAALVAAVAFAGAHAVQGRKSMLMIFATALLMHGLVAVSGTLLIAMVVHAAFDLVAAWLIAREAPAMIPREA